MAFAENEVPSSWLPETRDVESRCFQVMIRRVDNIHTGQHKILSFKFEVDLSLYKRDLITKIFYNENLEGWI